MAADRGLLDGAPVIFREQHGIAPLTGDLHGLVGLAHLINQGIEPLADFCGGESTRRLSFKDLFTSGDTAMSLRNLSRTAGSPSATPGAFLAVGLVAGMALASGGGAA